MSSKLRTVPKVDFMTRLEASFPILENYAAVSASPDFDITKCACLSIQVK
jgi:hypothetical protein